MKLLLVGLAVFLGSGAITTAVVSRIAGVRQTAGYLLSSMLATIGISAVSASATIALWAKVACATQSTCEYGGFMEGGLVVALLWLIIYSVIYLVVAYVIARYHSKKYAGSSVEAGPTIGSTRRAKKPARGLT